MTPILIALSYWLHALATVVFVGHFVLLAVVYLPALAENPAALSAISKRSRWRLYASMLVFSVTGVYLTLVDPNDMGIGKFSNFWSAMMLVKHLLILAWSGWASGSMLSCALVVDGFEHGRSAGVSPFALVYQRDGDLRRAGPFAHGACPGRFMRPI